MKAQKYIFWTVGTLWDEIFQTVGGQRDHNVHPLVTHGICMCSLMVEAKFR